MKLDVVLRIAREVGMEQYELDGTAESEPRELAWAGATITIERFVDRILEEAARTGEKVGKGCAKVGCTRPASIVYSIRAMKGPSA